MRLGTGEALDKHAADSSAMVCNVPPQAIDSAEVLLYGITKNVLETRFECSKFQS